MELERETEISLGCAAFIGAGRENLRPSHEIQLQKKEGILLRCGEKEKIEVSVVFEGNIPQDLLGGQQPAWGSGGVQGQESVTTMAPDSGRVRC